jgi:hypothetical protein
VKDNRRRQHVYICVDIYIYIYKREGKDLYLCAIENERVMSNLIIGRIPICIYLNILDNTYDTNPRKQSLLVKNL